MLQVQTPGNQQPSNCPGITRNGINFGERDPLPIKNIVKRLLFISPNAIFNYLPLTAQKRKEIDGYIEKPGTFLEKYRQ